jgi:pyridoxine kinase
MARILSLSSQVVHGHVGNSVSAFVLSRLGHEVLAVPTILLSNRPGYPAIHGIRPAVADLDAMLTALEANGMLRDVGAVVTGYMPTSGHVALAASWVEKLKGRNAALLYLCDPILGDEPAGVYIDPEAAASIRDTLIPLADLATPNRFELTYLTGASLSAENVAEAARSLGVPRVLVTSAPSPVPGVLRNLLVSYETVEETAVRERAVVAHGTGDFFAAVYLAHVLNGVPETNALRLATAGMDAVLDATGTAPELALIPTQNIWAQSQTGPGLQ